MTKHTTPPAPKADAPRRWPALSRWFGPVRRPTPRRRTRLGVESLEDRCVPAVFNVNSLADVLNPGPGTVTLRSAIQAANATPGGNTINLTVPGTYQITLAGTPGETDNAAGEFAILPGGGDLTIQNISGGAVTIDGGGHNRVFDINPTFNSGSPTAKFTVTLQGLTIENGYATDAANADGPNASGGGIRDQGNASLTLINDVVTGNSATADGGGIAMENTVSTPWTLTVNNSVISNNRAGDAGGGIDEDGSGKVFINGSTIAGNTSVNQGAGIWLDAVVDHLIFETANLTVTNSLIEGNTAVAAGNVGGGIGNAGNGTVTIQSSTVADNFVNGVGGGFGDENAAGTLVVVDSTFVGNSAVGNGGGIEAAGRSTTVNDSTVTGNVSQGQGGGLAVTSATFTLNNTVVAGNQANSNGGMNFQGTAPDVSATVTTGSGNFIGVGDASLVGITNGQSGNRVGTAASPLSPLLGPLQNNGGPTLTEAPLPGSPLIDGGVNTAVPAGVGTDQRGFQRSVGTVDIGAVEVQPPAPAPAPPAAPQAVAGIQDVTHSVLLIPIPQRVRHGHKANPRLQMFLVVNASGATLNGPVYLVLDRLTRGTALVGATGLSQSHVTPGDPVLLLTPGPLPAGGAASAVLVFAPVGHGHTVHTVDFVPAVLAGAGVV